MLETRRLILDAFELTDAPVLNEVRNDPRTIAYLGPRQPESLDETKRLIEAIRADNLAGRALSRAVRLKEPRALIGFAGVWRIDLEAQLGELGYLIAPAFWGQGYATEAVLALVEAFDAQHGLPLNATVHEENRYSIRVLERLGFTRLKALEARCWSYGRRGRAAAKATPAE